MRPELRRLQRLEHHLLGHPSPAETAEWELQLLLDPDLRADSEAQQLAYAALRRAGRRQLRHELRAIHHQLYGLHAEVAVVSGWRRHLKAVLAYLFSR